MYSVVLATMLTAGSATPSLGFGWFHGCHGCHGCCGGCYGSCYGCYGCCGGCYGGCHGCCGGCYGSCYGACYGCYGSCSGSCFGSCFGSCYGGWYGYGTWTSGCYGVAVAVPAPTAPTVTVMTTLPAPAKEVIATHAATVIVNAPRDVRITVNGEETTLTQEEQVFTTPELDPNLNYVYVFKAEAIRDGKPLSRTQRVRVRAGQEARVDFSELSAKGPKGSLEPFASR